MTSYRSRRYWCGGKSRCVVRVEIVPHYWVGGSVVVLGGNVYRPSTRQEAAAYIRDYRRTLI